ncbi:MAG: hypothetical protein WBA84_09990 [Carnobacterium sp.]|uniref:hypothetical protein n=1 Tax=Carnobacterium sp. TaxID=48221 RepID=UPI003C746072
MIFTTIDGLGLAVKHKRASVSFKLIKDFPVGNDKFDFKFDKETFKELCDHIKKVSLEVWPSLKPKDATSEASDYAEFYDKVSDNNGSLGISRYYHGLNINRPYLSQRLLYRFNKAKMQCFIYDLNKLEEME